MPTISQATRRIRNTRGSSFLTHGADDYDHRGLNKARRNLSKALIAEYLAEDAPEAPEATYKWVVVAWCVDGDKDYLDGFEAIGYHDQQADAVAQFQRIEGHFTEAPEWQQPWYEYREVNDWEI